MTADRAALHRTQCLWAQFPCLLLLSCECSDYPEFHQWQLAKILASPDTQHLLLFLQRPLRVAYYYYLQLIRREPKTKESQRGAAEAAGGPRPDPKALAPRRLLPAALCPALSGRTGLLAAACHSSANPEWGRGGGRGASDQGQWAPAGSAGKHLLSLAAHGP